MVLIREIDYLPERRIRAEGDHSDARLIRGDGEVTDDFADKLLHPEEADTSDTSRQVQQEIHISWLSAL